MKWLNPLYDLFAMIWFIFVMFCILVLSGPSPDIERATHIAETFHNLTK